MKALCIRQPYAEAILCGVKTIEVRSWLTRHRGDILITAAAKKPSAVEFPEFVDLDALPLGALVGIATLADVRPMTPDDADAALCDYVPGAYAWILTHVRVLANPQPVKSRLGLFDLSVTLRELTLVDSHQYGARLVQDVETAETS